MVTVDEHGPLGQLPAVIVLVARPASRGNSGGQLGAVMRMCGSDHRRSCPACRIGRVGGRGAFWKRIALPSA
jgi:hypothetical protein